MTNLCYDVLQALQGKTLATAESCTGGMIGAVITSIAGSSAVYKGGIISYTNEVKEAILRVDADILKQDGAVSAAVAQQMAFGARKQLSADVAISTTGLAGPGADEYGNPVGTVHIGYSDNRKTFSQEFLFAGNRNAVREQACRKALEIVLRENSAIKTGQIE